MKSLFGSDVALTFQSTMFANRHRALTLSHGQNGPEDPPDLERPWHGRRHDSSRNQFLNDESAGSGMAHVSTLDRNGHFLLRLSNRIQLRHPRSARRTVLTFHQRHCHIRCNRRLVVVRIHHGQVVFHLLRFSWHGRNLLSLCFQFGSGFGLRPDLHQGDEEQVLGRHPEDLSRGHKRCRE